MLLFLTQDGEIAISKDVLPDLGDDFEETSFGDTRGASRQFRGKSGVHIREYDDRFVIHVDRVDPRKDPLGHLIRDSPETILAAGAGLYLAKKTCDAVLGSDGNKEIMNPLSFFLWFLPLNWFFRKVKYLLFG